MGAADGCGADGGLVGAVAYPGAAARGYKYAGCAVVCSDQVGGLCPAGDVFGFCLPPYRKYFCGCAAAFSPQLSGWLFETANDSRAFGWLGGSIGIYRELQRVLLAASVDGLSEKETFRTGTAASVTKRSLLLGMIQNSGGIRGILSPVSRAVPNAKAPSSCGRRQSAKQEKGAFAAGKRMGRVFDQKGQPSFQPRAAPRLRQAAKVSWSGVSQQITLGQTRRAPASVQRASQLLIHSPPPQP